ncbi:hypothetical protein [Flavobacterium sp. UMI-01]|uniref:hypothetical protein n=1 Tax=Flavobacterium sp. UMI-01 TaxID=1441053 RepID=UPI001C7D5596|nr:hypothetical protein [Flavobacterium sp. UMI-01]GIZ10194.1 hypothetical protein FUMI01_29200 [Flavobacterium sp. UMI-01]
MEKNNILINEIVDFINKTIKYIPVISFLFLFFSSAELFAYYKYFSINIYNYITIEDLFFNFYTFFFEYLSIIFELLFSVLILYYALGFDKKKINFNWIIYIYVAIAIIVFAINEFTNYKISNIYFDLLCTFPYAFIYLNIIKNIDQSKIKILLAFLFIFGYFHLKVKYFSKENAKEIIENEQNTEIKFTYINRLIKSSSENIYIGETSNYIFFFAKKQSETTIYKKSDIQNLTYTKR